MANYINNKEFYQLLVDFRAACKNANENNLPQPRIPDRIGECFMMIATKLSSKGNFVGYTYKDEMIGDALENCVVAVHSFDPGKSTNPFAYFTQIIWYAFLRRIEKEKKQTYVKYKTLEELVIDSDLIEDEHGNGYSNFDLNNIKMKPIIEKFETKKAAKLKVFPEELEGLEKFAEE